MISAGSGSSSGRASPVELDLVRNNVQLLVDLQEINNFGKILRKNSDLADPLKKHFKNLKSIEDKNLCKYLSPVVKELKLGKK